MHDFSGLKTMTCHHVADIRELKQTNAAAVNQQISIQKD